VTLRTATLLPALAAVLVGLAAGFASSCGARHDAGAAAAPPPVAARLATAERVTAGRRTELAGTVVAERSTAVSSRVMAMVTAVHVAMGDEVKTGQPLVSIDPTSAEGQSAQARGALAQAEAALALARRNHERFRALAESRSASELELDLARSQLAQAEGAVEQSRGAVAAADAVARESKVVAPFDGRVTARLVEIGDLAAPGRPLVTIESRAGRRLSVEVPESLVRAADLARGAPVVVALDARPELGELEGHVAEVAPGPDPATHTYTVKVELPPAAGSPVAAGASGRAFLDSGRRETVRVPTAALLESGGLLLVVVVDGDGRALSRVVTIGDSTPDGSVEVLSGLRGGERVALGLAAAPAAGARIEALP
jgi:RND family efflux transporter MFP subunit